jgi:hypothetical protein
MTAKSDFTEEEWELARLAPLSAGMIVLTAQGGGTFRETYSMAKAYAEARKQHGESELLDEIVSTKPERDHARYHSPEELKQAGLQHLRDAIALLEQKATAAEVDDYRRFVVSLATKVAQAHKEDGSDDPTGGEEQAAIDEITTALSSSTT